MWLKFSIAIAMMSYMQLSFAIKCESVIVDDFRFEMNQGKLKVAFLDGKKTSALKIKYIENKSQSEKISGVIELENKSGEVCNKTKIEIDPIKLCRIGAVIEPWRFVTYGLSEVVSVVSLTADVRNEAVLFNSRICQQTKVVGRVYIQDSYLKGGDIEGLSNGVSSPGTPEFPPSPELPPVPTPDDKKLNFNYFTVKMVNVEISANPRIEGARKGITLEDSIINDNPSFLGEMSLKNSFVNGNGTYQGEAEVWGFDYFIPLIRNNLSGDNTITGIYYLQRSVVDSIIAGGISRKADGTLDMVAHIGDHNSDFYESYFYGFGHVGGEVQSDTFIHGYYVLPVTHGVLFESGVALNSATITGAILIDGNSAIDDAEVNGTEAHNNEDRVMHITNSTITTSEVYGSGTIINSDVYSCYITGQPYIRATVHHSNISCNAIVIGTFTSGISAGCDWGHPDKNYKNKKVNDIVGRVMSSYRKDNFDLRSQMVSLETKAFELYQEKLKIQRRK